MNETARHLSAKRHYDTAVSLHRQNRLAEAERHYLAVRRVYPEHPGVLHGLGLIALRTARFEEAAECLQRASEANAANPAIRCDLGSAYLRLGRFEDALTCFQTVLTAEPGNIAALSGTGDALSILGRISEARDVFKRLVARDTGNAAGHFGIGNALAQLGRTSEARANFERAVALAPGRATYHRALAETARFVDGDPRLAALELLAGENLTDAEAVELHFALAKAYDDLKRPDAAFAQLRKGNALKRKLIPYNEAAVAEFFGETASAFTPTVMQRQVGDPSTVPIFIVGMPRSGTTLVEQILASDPRVLGAGELTALPTLIADGYAGENYPRDIAMLSDDSLGRLGCEYVRRLGTLPPGVTHVVDKLPANFRHIGLIRLVLPNARIVHVRRDPLDTCFSCYAKLFLNGLNYAYDLAELGRYFNLYDKLMAHWRAVLPAHAMLDVQYESLVRDFENESRRIVEYCGLEWSERFLSFHETDRPVRTHSQSQVRQPLFTSSIGRWRLYEAFLRPLREALDQAA